MKRFALLLLAGLFSPLVSCTPQADETGSKTNWFSLCEFDKDCGVDALCICGVCTQPCDGDSCSGDNDGTCLPMGDQRLQISCETPPPLAGVCAASCTEEVACPTGTVCVGGACFRGSPSACSEAFAIELQETRPLYARQGCHVSDALYLPVHLPDDSSWENEAPPHELRFQVTDEEGHGVAHCPVRLLSEGGHGVGLALHDTTDESGIVSALWIAGTEPESVLTASVLRGDGSAISTRASAEVRAHDEQPQAEENAAPLVRPSTLAAFFGLPQSARGVRSLTTPRKMPHHAFSAAIHVPGLYAGLQNTSQEGEGDGTIPEEDRILIASVWNTESGGLAEILESSDDIVCETHTDGEGGLRCNLDDAWELDKAALFEVTWQILQQDEVGELSSGAEAPPCTAPVCTDYHVRFFRGSTATNTPDLVVTFRRPELTTPTSAQAFLQPYGTTPGQTSCLATPEYATDFVISALAGESWQEITSATAYSVYRPGLNEVCANYEAHQSFNEFSLSTGGSKVRGVPYRPESTWPVGH